MSVFKCKMCGGTIEYEPGATVGVCDSCGTTQTLPRLDDDRKSNLYDRANHFRRSNDFDKAEAIYEQILNEDTTDAEAYWSLVLCRYGIEYVEDPSTHKRVPTVNRTQFTSIFDDDNYKSAIQYADSYQREIYESEAKTINDIQKGILAISQKEEPFDVFICYKETDNNGRRTPDSVLANDLYHQLTQEGFKVFFARITLEDKLGSAYEPYIFAALNSAKVMVVLGTKPEYFKAVWVKNEWSRYLSLVKQSNGKKVLIPAYRDMDPYDLPDEFSHLQAQDMSKLGFMQDLIRGIKKIVDTDDVNQNNIFEDSTINDTQISGLIKRAYMAIEEEDWNEADELFERSLDLDPENPQAYLGKLLVELRIKKKRDLIESKIPLENSKNYKKIINYGNVNLKEEIAKYNQIIIQRNEKERVICVYDKALKVMETANDEDSFKEACNLFESVLDYKDAKLLQEQCLKKVDKFKKDKIYSMAKKDMEKGTLDGYKDAYDKFGTIKGWLDSDELIVFCTKKVTEFSEKALKDQQRKTNKERTFKIIGCILICLLVLLGIGCYTYFYMIVPNNSYNKAIELYESGQYKESFEIFSNLKIKDSGVYAKKALAMLNKYNDYDIVDEDESGSLYACAYNEQNINFSNTLPGETIKLGCYEQDNNLDNGAEEIEWLVLDKEKDKILVISKYVLDHQKNYYGTWDTSTVRIWLGEEFYNNAFSLKYKNVILETHITAKSEEVQYGKCSDTDDYVFLLDSEELEKYSDLIFSDSLENCTSYSLAKLKKEYPNNYSFHKPECEWWLRKSSTLFGYYRTDIEQRSIFDNDFSVALGVRPAMWLSTESQ